MADEARVALLAPSPILTALYATMVTGALSTRLAVLTGPRSEEVIDPDFYRRLAGDLRGNGCTVVADLSGKALVAALAGGLDVLHLSERELGEHIGVAPSGLPETIAAMEQLRDEGARNTIVSRAREPALALLDHRRSSCPGRCSKSVSTAARATRCSPRSLRR